MWGLKGLRVETGDIVGIKLRRREVMTAARAEDETVYVSHLHLGRCPPLLRPIPVLVLLNLLCTDEDIKCQRAYLLT